MDEKKFSVIHWTKFYVAHTKRRFMNFNVNHEQIQVTLTNLSPNHDVTHCGHIVVHVTSEY